jgi:hypothetical protein
LPVIITATATDACGRDGDDRERLVCTKLVDGESVVVPLADCPVTINGDTIEIDGRLTDGELDGDVRRARGRPDRQLRGDELHPGYDPDRDNDGDRRRRGQLRGDGQRRPDRQSTTTASATSATSAPTRPTRTRPTATTTASATRAPTRTSDGVLDIVDNCETDANTDQLDMDDDALGDVCDPTPYEGLTAEGDGGCSGGGAGGIFGGLLGLLGLALVIGRRRLA